MDEIWKYIAIIIAGAIAGFINTLAGSGSAITLPILIELGGLPATVANGTNRIGVLAQSLISSGEFAREGKMDWRGLGILAIPTSIGALLGARIAADLNEQGMNIAIGVMLVLVLGMVLARPKRWLQGREEGEQRPGWLQFLIFFGIGVYGGFIQAGVGIFLLAGLVLGMGYSLVRANAVKVGLVLIFNVFALWVFLVNDQVDWLLGGVLAVGNLIGGWAAARFATRDWAQVWVYRLLIVFVVAAAIRMFWRAFA